MFQDAALIVNDWYGTDSHYNLGHLARQINNLQDRISYLQGENFFKTQQISTLNEQVGCLSIKCNFLEEQNWHRFTEIRLLKQDAELWVTW